eukprot:jgi/Mesvir1/13921/Mv16042-RA.1
MRVFASERVQEECAKIFSKHTEGVKKLRGEHEQTRLRVLELEVDVRQSRERVEELEADLQQSRKRVEELEEGLERSRGDAAGARKAHHDYLAVSSGWLMDKNRLIAENTLVTGQLNDAKVDLARVEETGLAMQAKEAAISKVFELVAVARDATRAMPAYSTHGEQAVVGVATVWNKILNCSDRIDGYRQMAVPSYVRTMVWKNGCEIFLRKWGKRVAEGMDRKEWAMQLARMYWGLTAPLEGREDIRGHPDIPDGRVEPMTDFVNFV